MCCNSDKYTFKAVSGGHFGCLKTGEANHFHLPPCSQLKASRNFFWSTVHLVLLRLAWCILPEGTRRRLANGPDFRCGRGWETEFFLEIVLMFLIWFMSINVWMHNWYGFHTSRKLMFLNSTFFTPTFSMKYPHVNLSLKYPRINHWLKNSHLNLMLKYSDMNLLKWTDLNLSLKYPHVKL